MNLIIQKWWDQIIFPIKTFIYLHWHAKQIAITLDDCTRAMGQMSHPHRDDANKSVMHMPLEVRNKLLYQAHWQALPTNWKWRKD